MFITSNGQNSLAVWTTDGSEYDLWTVCNYNEAYGSANSAIVLDKDNRKFFVCGHEEGFITIWSISEFDLRLIQTVDLRSNKPIPSPYKLWNIRGIIHGEPGTVV